jgi:putative tricarboxylic transport membrane protein
MPAVMLSLAVLILRFRYLKLTPGACRRWNKGRPMMKMQLRLIALAVLVGLGATPASFAQGYKPTRPVEVVVHTGPGGGSDVLARAIALMVEKENLLPVRMQVVNKPGGGSAVAAAYLAEKKGDQNTIGFFTGVWLTNPLTSASAKVTLKDLTPIARLVLEPALIAVKADAPYKTLADFTDAAKKNPGQLKQSGGSITSRTTRCGSFCRSTARAGLHRFWRRRT